MKLSIAITILLTVISFACTEPQPKETIIMETYIINNSNLDIDYILYGYNQSDAIDTFNILNGEYINKICYNNRFPEGADSIIIEFNNKKKITYLPYEEDKRERNVFLIDAYEIEKINEEYYKFIYTFTNEDYNNAIPIN